MLSGTQHPATSLKRPKQESDTPRCIFALCVSLLSHSHLASRLCPPLFPSALLHTSTRLASFSRTRLSAHRLNILYVQKQASVPKCGDCGDKLRGIKALRPAKLKGTITSKRQKHVTRAYGGARCVPTIH
jgi:ribosomal protein L34E